MVLEHTLLSNALLIAIAVTTLWGVSLMRRDVSIIDIFWGLGFVLITWNSMRISDTLTPRSILLTLLITVWVRALAAILLGETRENQKTTVTLPCVKNMDITSHWLAY